MAKSPHPIGYLEIQKSWIGQSTTGPFNDSLAAADAEALISHPNHKRVSYRIDCVIDGAGIKHYNLYVGYAPANPTTEPLNPRDLNDARNQNMGDPARDNFIGAKEQKF